MNKSIYEICIELEKAGLPQPPFGFGQTWYDLDYPGRIQICSGYIPDPSGERYHTTIYSPSGTGGGTRVIYRNNAVWQPTEGDLIRAIQNFGLVSKIELLGNEIILRCANKTYYHFFEAENLFENLANAYIWAKENLK